MYHLDEVLLKYDRLLDAAYREAGTVMETVLANPNNADVTKTLEGFKTTLKSIWE